jgi:hypothetical protein
MFAVLLALLATAATAAESPRLVLTRFTAATPRLEQAAAALQEALAAELLRTETALALGPAALDALLGEAGRAQLAACAPESGACLAEVVAGLGAPWLVTGRLTAGPRAPRVELRLLRARDGKVAWRSGAAPGEDTDFTRAFAAAARAALAAQGLPAVALDAAPAGLTEASLATPPPVAAQWLTVGAGAAAVVAGAVLCVLAGVGWGHLQSDAWRNATPWKGLQDEMVAYNRNVLLGPSLAGGGLAVVGAGVIWLVLTRDTPLATVTVSPRAGGLAVGGAW